MDDTTSPQRQSQADPLDRETRSGETASITLEVDRSETPVDHLVATMTSDDDESGVGDVAQGLRERLGDALETISSSSGAGIPGRSAAGLQRALHELLRQRGWIEQTVLSGPSAFGRVAADGTWHWHRLPARLEGGALHAFLAAMAETESVEAVELAGELAALCTQA